MRNYFRRVLTRCEELAIGDWPPARLLSVYELLVGWSMRGIHYLLRGLRSGRRSLVLVGVGMILVRLAGASRRTKVADFVLEGGSSATLRVTEPGADPVTLRVDAAGRD
ncbi:MAG: hypothetical protein OXF41_01085 [bacterium]|nr:hypothetical protein [bacterium]